MRLSRNFLSASSPLTYQARSSVTSKAEISETNQFWLRHQIKTKPNFHAHVNLERGVALAALISPIAAVACPGVFLIDQVVAISWIYHSYFGVEAMILDYIPLVLPLGFAKFVASLWLLFCLLMVCLFTNFNLKTSESGHTGMGHTLRAIMSM
jgi:succinate dehydrogenase hydrophobic anchor subunit